MAVLDVADCTVMFGGLAALRDLSIHVGEGELVGLIGPNGAGKTTLFNVVTGVNRPTRGTVLFRGRSVIGRLPSRLAARGIARTFQNIRLFGGLSVLDNVRIGCAVRHRAGYMAAGLRTRGYFRAEAAIRRRAMELLHQFGLDRFAAEQARSLPYGEQRRLEIARALGTEPKLLLLDEPAAGMNPAETEELMALICQVRRDFDLTVLLIEHDMRVVMGICERVYVLDYGQVICEGPPEVVTRDPKVIEAYLGAGPSDQEPVADG